MFRAAYFEALHTELISPADVRRGIERLDLAATDLHSDATDLLAGAAVACLETATRLRSEGARRFSRAGRSRVQGILPCAP